MVKLGNRYSDTSNLLINFLLVVLAFLLPLYRNGVSAAAPLLILLWMAGGDYREKWQAIKRNRLVIAVLVYIGINLVSLLWSSNPAEGWTYVTKLRYLLLVPAIAASLRPGFVRPVLAAFLGGIMVSLLWSYGLYLGVIHFGKNYPKHPAPTMSHLDYSIFIAVAALLVLDWAVRQPRSMTLRMLGLAAFAVVAAGLFINIGRSGQLAFFGALLVVLPGYLSSRPFLRLAASALAVILALNIVYTTVPRFALRIDDGITDVGAAIFDRDFDSNVGERIAGMLVAAEIIKEHPVLGTGVGDNMGEFRHLLDTRFPHLEKVVSWFPHLHNQYLQTTSELGLIGLLVLLNLFVQLFRERPREPLLQNLAVILGSVYLFGFMGDPFLHKQLPLTLFATLAGMVAAVGGSRWWPEPAAASDSSS
jgi:O-antigen ligase